eukprot:COSAG06_NODE_25288_length_640_cov_1.554529_1_plen_135_part_10
MSVMMAHLATFVKTDADMVLARRAAPHNSYTQVLERCMTIMNMAWQGLSTARSELSDHGLESILEKAQTAKDIRELCGENAEFQRQYRASHEPVLAVLNQFAGEMELKGTPVIIEEAADDEQIAGMLQYDSHLMY